METQNNTVDVQDSVHNTIEISGDEVHIHNEYLEIENNNSAQKQYSNITETKSSKKSAKKRKANKAVKKSK